MLMVFHHRTGRHIDDGNGAVLGVRGPQLPAIGRQVEALGPSADVDQRLFRTAIGSAFDDANVSRAHVGGEQHAAIPARHHHVGAFLIRREAPVHAAGSRVEPPDALPVLGGEVHVVAAGGEPVRPAQIPEVHPPAFHARAEINDIEGVAGGLPAVVADDGGTTVGGDFHLMRICTRRDGGGARAGGPIDERQRGVSLVQHQQRGGCGGAVKR